MDHNRNQAGIVIEVFGILQVVVAVWIDSSKGHPVHYVVYEVTGSEGKEALRLVV